MIRNGKSYCLLARYRHPLYNLAGLDSLIETPPSFNRLYITRHRFQNHFRYVHPD